MKYNNKDVTEITYNGKIVQTWIHNGVEVHNAATGFEFAFNSSSNSYTVTGYTSQDTGKEIRIPSTYRGYPVTKIAVGAFSSLSIKGITIPASITSIEYVYTNFHFSGSNIEYINVDDNNPNYSSQDGVLYNKNKTTLIRYPGGKTDSHFNVPSGVTSIAASACAGAEFATITLPNSLSSLSYYSFYNCFNLSEIVIPDSVTYIGECSFQYCWHLSKVQLSENITHIYKGTFTGTSIEEITIPKNVTTVLQSAFAGCYKLTSIKVATENATYSSCDGNLASKDGSVLHIFAPGKSGEVSIPLSITTIREHAFYDCPNITKINIGIQVVSIEEAAFYDCEKLESFNVVEGNTNYLSDYDVLYDKQKTLLIKYPANRDQNTYSVHANRVGRASFYGCNKLVTLILPTSVVYIGQEMARYSHSLIYLRILSQNEVTIGSLAFQDCDNLIYLYLGTGIKTVDTYAFDQCDSLRYIYYQGSSDDWNNIQIKTGNTQLRNASKHYDHNVFE